MDTSKIIEFGKTATLRKRQQPLQQPEQFTELAWNSYSEDGSRGVTALGAAGHGANSTASGIYHEGRVLHQAIMAAIPRIKQRQDNGRELTPAYFETNFPAIHKRMGDADLQKLVTPFEDWDDYYTQEGHRRIGGMVNDLIIDSFHHAIPVGSRDYIANCYYGGKLKSKY